MEGVVPLSALVLVMGSTFSTPIARVKLTPHNCYSQQPKPHPIKYRVAEHLLDMLVHYNQLQGLKTLKVAFHHATKDEAVIHNIRLAKQSTIGDVLEKIKGKVFVLC
ncbi:ubiquitin carboxyl-terminal hydrolase 12 [Artemisia annua]|uniref:Ubiquitin carboxyl-terminal hydrolase 12 n=1 Tax=Artemisia annua TaxID=35608 RepID=A0A2U1MFG1_ARTAN|nr:ubiquitin carboxyl-terminal hydrolase 12 [Artemisia annua]